MLAATIPPIAPPLRLDDEDAVGDWDTVDDGEAVNGDGSVEEVLRDATDVVVTPEACSDVLAADQITGLRF